MYALVNISKDCFLMPPQGLDIAQIPSEQQGTRNMWKVGYNMLRSFFVEIDTFLSYILKWLWTTGICRPPIIK